MKSKINVLIGIYEMIGGIWGIYILIAHSALKQQNSQIFSLMIAFFILTLYALSLIGGFLLWNKNEKGAVISVVVQVFQIPYVITSSCIYCITSGLQLVVGIVIFPDMIRLMGKWYLTPYFEMYFRNVIKYSGIGISIVPILIILYIRKIQKISKSNQLEAKNQVTNVTNNVLS